MKFLWSTKEFLRINQEREFAGEPLYANPRNLPEQSNYLILRRQGGENLKLFFMVLVRVNLQPFLILRLSFMNP